MKIHFGKQLVRRYLTSDKNNNNNNMFKKGILLIVILWGSSTGLYAYYIDWDQNQKRRAP